MHSSKLKLTLVISVLILSSISIGSTIQQSSEIQNSISVDSNLDLTKTLIPSNQTWSPQKVLYQSGDYDNLVIGPKIKGKQTVLMWATSDYSRSQINLRYGNNLTSLTEVSILSFRDLGFVIIDIFYDQDINKFFAIFKTYPNYNYFHVLLLTIDQNFNLKYENNALPSPNAANLRDYCGNSFVSFSKDQFGTYNIYCGRYVEFNLNDNYAIINVVGFGGNDGHIINIDNTIYAAVSSSKITLTNNKLDWTNAWEYDISYDINYVIDAFVLNNLIYVYYELNDNIYSINSYDYGVNWGNQTTLIIGNSSFSSDLIERYEKYGQFEDGSWYYTHLGNNEGAIVYTTDPILDIDTAYQPIIQTNGVKNFKVNGSYVNGTPLADKNVEWTFYYPNGSLWFSWMTTTNSSGHSSFDVNMIDPYSNGEFYVSVSIINNSTTKVSTYFTFIQEIPVVPNPYNLPELEFEILDYSISIVENNLVITLDGNISIYTQIYFTISVLDPDNIMYQSIEINEWVGGEFNVELEFDLTRNGVIKLGSYEGQFIISNAPYYVNGDLLEYIEFSFDI